MSVIQASIVDDGVQIAAGSDSGDDKQINKPATPPRVKPAFGVDPWQSEDPWEPSLRPRAPIGPSIQPKGSSYYPVFEDFEWDEDAERVQPIWHASKSQQRVKLTYHTATRLLNGKEGLLVDCGAVWDLAGSEHVRRQSAAALPRGFPTQWSELDKPRQMSGVGKGAVTCSHQATEHGVIETGELITYSPTVVPPDPVTGEPSQLPALYGLNSMAAENVYMGTKNGLMALVPDGADDQIVWPPGTRFRQCEKAPSGHWILVISHWDKLHQKATGKHIVPPPGLQTQ